VAYTINNTAGTVIATVTDGTIDTSTDLILIGKNFTGYGEIQNENFVKLLENFANTTAPSSPQDGQLWWDSTGSLLKVYDGNQFKTVSSSTAQGTEPTGAVVGDLWWDTANDQLNVYDGNNFVLIGPAFTVGTGTSGAIVVIVTDTGASDHVVVQTIVSDVIVAITSKDATFTPQTPIPGFATIIPGLNLVSAGTITGAQFTGTASDADQLGGIVAANFLRSDIADTTAGTLKILNDTGFFVGVDDDVSISVTGVDATIKNQTANGDLIFNVNDGGVPTNVLTIDGATATVSMNSKKITNLATPTATTDAATKAYVDGAVATAGALLDDGSVTIKGDLVSDVTNTRDLGAVANVFANVYATTFVGQSTSAQYADIAERFEADATYLPGTVVAIGGEKEITAILDAYTDDVFGVISTQPAHLMNAGAGSNETHPPIAMSGRVPVRVVGKIKKGDRLVSAGNGLACAATAENRTPYNVLGRSLDHKTTEGEGVVEATVRLNS